MGLNHHIDTESFVELCSKGSTVNVSVVSTWKLVIFLKLKYHCPYKVRPLWVPHHLGTLAFVHHPSIYAKFSQKILASLKSNISIYPLKIDRPSQKGKGCIPTIHFQGQGGTLQLQPLKVAGGLPRGSYDVTLGQWVWSLWKQLDDPGRSQVRDDS